MNFFRRELLPVPRQFFEAEIGQLTRPNRKGWALGNCPFHQSKSGKSFSVNVDSGAFFCHGCGRKGDLIGFLMQRDGLSFERACRQLGCWEDDGKRTKVRPGPLVRYLVMDCSVDGVEYRAEVRDEATTELQRLRRFYADAKDRLSEIRQGDAEKFECEEEIQWSILADSWELIQMMEVCR